jgi:hypothetical protein
VCNDVTVSNKILKILIKSGADITAKDDDGCSVFLRICEKGRRELLDFFFSLEHSNFNLNETASCGSALHMAIIGDKEEIVQYLINSKIDLSLKDSNGNTAILLAIKLHMNNSFKMILDEIIQNTEYSTETKKILLNTQNEDGNTILHELAYNKLNFLIGMIKKLPADFTVDQSTTNKDGNTYIQVSESLVKLQHDKEAREKLIREETRKEKERIAKEKREEDQRIKEQHFKLLEEEENRRKIGETFVKYRGAIFLAILVLLLFVLYFFVNRAATRKKEILI